MIVSCKHCWASSGRRCIDTQQRLVPLRSLPQIRVLIQEQGRLVLYNDRLCKIFVGVVISSTHSNPPLFPPPLPPQPNWLLEAFYSGSLLLLLGFPPLFTRCACGLLIWWAGIQLSSYAFAPEVTAGPSAPTTAIWSVGSTFFDWPDDFFARSPPLPPRRFCGKRVLIQVL